VTLYLLFVDTGRLLDAITTVSAKSYAIALGFASVVLFLNGVRWAVFVRSSRFPHSLATLIRIRLIAQGLNAFLPGGVIGDGLQVFLITRNPKLSGPRALSSVLLDRMVALFVLLAVLGSTLGNSFPGISAGVVVTIAAVCVAVPFIVMFLLLKFESYIAGFNGSIRQILMFGVRMAFEIKKAIKKPKILSLAALLAFLGNLLTVGILWQLANEFAVVPFGFMVPLVSVIVFLTLIPFTFSGLGVREAAIFAGLEGFGVSLEQAVAISFIWLTVTILTNLIYSGLAVLFSPEPETIGKIYQHFIKLRNET